MEVPQSEHGLVALCEKDWPRRRCCHDLPAVVLGSDVVRRINLRQIGRSPQAEIANADESNDGWRPGEGACCQLGELA